MNLRQSLRGVEPPPTVERPSDANARVAGQDTHHPGMSPSRTEDTSTAPLMMASIAPSRTDCSGANLHAAVKALNRSGRHVDDSPSVDARRTIMAAITTRVTEQCGSAARAATTLQLSGPRVTDLINGKVDKFTLDELVDLLPRVGMTLQLTNAH
jgi:predicted XRE-type DNA-binding protein